MFSRLILAIGIVILSSHVLCAQFLRPGGWRMTFDRGGTPVHVALQVRGSDSGVELSFVNDTETLTLDVVRPKGDSLVFDWPLFEARFELVRVGADSLRGRMLKGTAAGAQEWLVGARPSAERVPGPADAPAVNIGGRWALQIQRADGSWRNALGEFRQEGGKLTGTILNPSGDYRFLEGVVRGRRLYLSVFDGAHVYAFTADIPNDSTLANGLFFTGTPPGTAFRGMRNEQAQPPPPERVPGLRDGESTLRFRFPDLDSNLVSLADERFRGKVVIVQLMGSWCPNCMDETRFLSELYNSGGLPGVEVVSLAYELSEDFRRSAASLRKFRDRFDVRYPMLITGVRSADPEKAAKTLPMLTEIPFFPTTIFLDRQGRVRKIHPGYYGPGAQAYHEAFLREFHETLRELLAEP